MNTAAPQAPVTPNGKSSKNRKTPGGAVSAALGRGVNKGSALFQQLMSAHAALKGAGAKLVPPSDGLKGATTLAALLKAAQTTSVKTGVTAAALTEQEKLDIAHKAARAKTLAALADGSQVAAHAATQLKSTAAKEKKPDTSELAKAPVVEGKGLASRAEPLLRVLDLRRAEKPRAALETEGRKVEASLTSDKDPTAGLGTRLGAAREIFSETLPKPAPVAASSAQTPLERLREMAGSELVRASNLVLRDGGGEIRLVLKPESLGSVRIRMNVVDNTIEGRIIVDSSAVKHVIDGSVDALRRALTADGFQMGSLQVSVGGQNADTGDRHREEQAPTVRRVAAQGFERNVPGTEEMSLGDMFVNLFV